MKKIFFSLTLIILYFINISQLYAEAKVPIAAKNGMVVTEQYLASQIGVDILQAGGNAIDAAVAVGYALAVVNPCCGNIGGGGFMTLHLADGKNIFLNFRERAPLAATQNMYLDASGKVIPNKSTFGYAAVGTPGTVMGFETALKKYGTMTRKQVMAPAIRLATEGYILSPGDIQLLSYHLEDFKKSPNVMAIFFKGGKPLQAGDHLIQTDLANTLRLISDKGADAFYKGKIAEDIVKASSANGGILSLKDFSEYRIEEMTPIQCNYEGYTIYSAPPPSSGGTTLCEALNILEAYPLKKLKFHTAQSAHYTIEAMRLAFVDRNSQLGDPDFVTNPTAKLISKEYAATLRKKIKADHATPSSEFNPGQIPLPDGVHTTHYSIIDKSGNAVSVTYTLNSLFGAQVIAGDTGFFLNNEMDDFTAKPGVANQFGLIEGDKDAIQPGKRPLSAMTPTIIMKDGKVVIIVGSPGGPRIITSTLQTILNVFDYGMNIQEAIDAPRFHQQWLPDTVYVEPMAFSAEAYKTLKTMGYDFTQQDPWSAVEAIYIDPQSKTLYGASDSRRPAGRAIGY